MYNINIVVGGKPSTIDVTKRDTVGSIRQGLYVGNKNVLEAKAKIKRFPGLSPLWQRTEDIILNENQSVVDALYIYEGIALEFEDLENEQHPIKTQSFPDENHTPPAKGSKPSDTQLMVKIPYTTPKELKGQIHLTDLSMKDLDQLLQLNKISYGRFLDENNKVQTCESDLFRYSMKTLENTTAVLEDINSSYALKVDNLSELDKELIKEGITTMELSAKVPFLSALSFEDRIKSSKSITESRKKKYTCIEHVFPVGEIRFDLVNKGAHKYELKEQFKTHFTYNKLNFQGIQNFYRKYGQFVMKRIVLGIKHIVESNKETNSLKETQSNEEKVGGKVAAQYKGFGLSVGGSDQDTTTDTKKSNTERGFEHVTVVGGTSTQLLDIRKLASSIQKWKFWRIIQIKDVWPIDYFLDEKVRDEIRKQLHKREYTYKLWTGEMMFRELGVLFSPASQHERWSPSRAVSPFNQDIFQIVPIFGQWLLLVQKKRIDRVSVDSNQLFQLPIKNVIDFIIQLKEIIGCASDSINLYVAEESKIHVFTLPNFVPQPSSIKISKPRISIHRYDCVVNNGSMLGCGPKGLFFLNVQTATFTQVASGDFSKCEIVRVQNRVYLFGENVTCVDLVSRCSSVIEDHPWSPGQPTTNNYQVLKCSNGKLFRIRGAKVSQISFTNGTINTNRFAPKASVCFMKHCLYLPNQNSTYLIQYPLDSTENIEAVKGQIANRDSYGSRVVSPSSVYANKPDNYPYQYTTNQLRNPSDPTLAFGYRSNQVQSPSSKATFYSNRVIDQ